MRGLEVWGHPTIHMEFKGQPKIYETLLSKKKEKGRGKKRKTKYLK